MESKYKRGDIVKHPLGFECMVLAGYDVAIHKAKDADGNETETREELKEPIYELQFFTKLNGLQTVRLEESLIR